MLSTTDQLRIINFLKQFGCNSRESLAYMEALKLGTASVQELARKLNRNRITVHYTVQQLVKKGLLFETRKGKRRLVSAETPEVLFRIIEERYSQLKSMENNIDYVTKLLSSIQTVKQEETIIKVYEDIGGIKKMLEESLQSANELMLIGSKATLPAVLGNDYFENFFLKRAEQNLPARILYPKCDFLDKLNSKKTDLKIDLKIFPQNSRSEAGFFIWGKTTALESVKNGKTNCTIIENKDITAFFHQNIFEHFWKEAHPYQ